MKLPVIGMTVLFLAGPAILAAGDINENYQALQQAVEKKDIDGVKKLALEVYPQVTELLKTPAPQGADEKKDWTAQMDYGKSVGSYAEYGLFAMAVIAEPAKTIDLVNTLESLNPKSKYLDQSYPYYLIALNKTGAQAKIPEIAEKGLVNFPENEDLLQVVMEAALTKNQTGKAVGYAQRLVAALNKHTKPEGVPQADWDRKKSSGLGRGYFIIGFTAGQANQFKVADTNLRAALPMIQGIPSMAGPALFYLGVANYNIGKMTLNKAKMLEAAKFSDQCAAIAGPFQDQALHNSALIKKEAAGMR